MNAYSFVPLRQSLPYWPTNILGEPEFLDEIGVRDFSIEDGDDLFAVKGTVLWFREIAFTMPGLEGLSLALLCESGHATAVPFEFNLLPTQELRLPQLSASLRWDTSLLRPVSGRDGRWVPKLDAQGRPLPAEVRLEGVGISLDADGNINVVMPAGSPQLSLGAVALGDTGFVLEISGVSLYLSRKQTAPVGAPAGFRGVAIASAKLHFPDGLDVPLDPDSLTFKDLLIGTGGFSGTISGNWAPVYSATARSYSGDGAGKLCGVPFGIKSLTLTFKQNVPVSSILEGELVLPFFDSPIGITINIGIDGSFRVALAATQPTGVNYTSGLVTLEKPGLISITLDSIAFEIQKKSLGIKLSGGLTPLFGAPGVQWPTLAVKELSVDSEGNVRMEGGWLDLPNQYALDFHGFKIEITKIGFGKTDDGKKWIGFSGGLKLVEALPAGASVEGLRLIWDEAQLLSDPANAIRVTLNGVGVEFAVPGVVKFKGAISYSGPITGTLASGGTETVERFDGSIRLELTALGLEIDAVLVVGSARGDRGNYSFFAIYLGVELPAGIPLWSSGLALYGAAGLFALAMEPNRRPDEKWYGVGPDDGWYKRKGIIGVTDLKTKWDPNPEAVAFGAGVTIGTVDNGFTFAGRVLLVIVLPGPIIMLEGRANLLKERASLKDEPLFRAIAILDNRAGLMTVGLDAQYRVDKGGELIDIHGGTEAFFSFHDADAWHLYLGEREPRERRIQADIFKLWKANGYFMLDSHHIQTGAWVGIEKSWTFSPLSVTLEAWVEGGAELSFKPPQFHGSLWLHGKLDARIFGFGLTVSADATCTADVFRPMKVVFEFHVTVDLPCPLPKVEADFTLQWGPIPDPPPLPLPLKEVAVEHFKVTTKWPLPRVFEDTTVTPSKTYSLLFPNYDANKDGFRVPSRDDANDPVPVSDSFMPSDIPVVPLDARPRITFGRSVVDAADVGVNTRANAEAAAGERIGDPTTGGSVLATYTLIEIALEKHIAGSTWQVVGSAPEKKEIKKLYGSWAPVPCLPEGDRAAGTPRALANTQLWLWSKSPFDYTRHGGLAWDEWFTDTVQNYPCPVPPPDRTICCDFESLPVGTQLRSPWTCPEHPEISLSWTTPAVGTVTALPKPIDGHRRALCFPGSSLEGDGTVVPVVVTIELPPDGKGARIVVAAKPNGQDREDHECVDFKDVAIGASPNPRREAGLTFAAWDQHALAQQTHTVNSAAGPGLDCASRLEVDLPRPAASVEVTLVHSSTPAIVEAFDSRGRRTDSQSMRAPRGQPERLVLKGPDIVQTVISAPEREALLLIFCHTRPSPKVKVTGYDSGGNLVAGKSVSSATGGSIGVAGDALNVVRVSTSEGACIMRICVTLKPAAADVQRYQAMAKHLVRELVRWSQAGEVLEPHTTYRLKVVTRIDVSDWPYEDFPSIPPGQYKYNGQRNQTEYAYFRTEGPPCLSGPGLSIPIGTPSSNEFDSGLGDLTRYVLQTVPPTVPAAGEKPPLPQPVYRAYDVGLRFNEDYVDLMYRIDQRDLSLYLYDNSNRPVRDARGRLVVVDNPWGRAEERTLSESEQRWAAIINASTCASLDQTETPTDRVLTSRGSGHVLNADTLYEARLIPLLVHDDFSRGLSGWGTPVDQGTTDGPSKWAAKYHPTILGDSATTSGTKVTLGDLAAGTTDLSAVDPSFDILLLKNDTARASRQYRIVAVDSAAKAVIVDGTPSLSSSPSAWEIPSSGAVVQTSQIGGGDLAGDNPVKPGTMLVRGDPAGWKDYRFSVLLRSSAGGAIGVVFRTKDASNYYRFSMDCERPYRRLVRVVNDVHTVLAQDGFVYARDSDYLIAIEAIGQSLRVYQDGDLVFDVADGALASGRIGLYTWADGGARFSDVRVDDFGLNAPIAYRFNFTTSRFTNFFHHLHSYEDETWHAPGTIAASAVKAVPPTTPPGDQEWRDYDALVRSLPESAAQEPAQVEVTRLEESEQAVGFLLRSPEPIDWRHTDIELKYAARALPRIAAPATVKLTEASFGTTNPNEESVDLVLRASTDLSGYSIERHVLPATLAEPSGNAVLFADDFDQAPRGLFFREDFGPDTLDRYAIVDEASPGLTDPKSAWAISGGHLVQTANYMGGGSTEGSPEKPGTLAVTGSPAWGNVRITATIRSEDRDDIGLVFRYRDSSHYYRFSMSRFGQYRRLVKNINGNVTVLWSDTTPIALNQPYELVIETFGDWLVGSLDGQPLFMLRDATINAGRVGFYCWRNPKAQFEALRVESLESSPVLWHPDFGDLNEFSIMDEGRFGGPSKWGNHDGVLTQSSWIRASQSGTDRTRLASGRIGVDAAYGGTFAAGGDLAWEDIRVAMRLRSDTDGAIGVMFRYQGPQDYYRFSMDRRNGYRRLIKKVGGRVKVLWKDAVKYKVGQTYELTLQAVGSELRGYLDGALLFSVRDNARPAGRIALYCANNTGARFERIVVADATRRLGQWIVHDGGVVNAPSVWRMVDKAMLQTSRVGGGQAPAALGTLAVAGSSRWTDYRMSVRLLSSDPNAVGLVFRYVDADNYYRLSFDSNKNEQRLVRRLNGSTYTLWQQAGSLPADSPIDITVDAIGARLRAYAGRTRLFEIMDASHSAGRVGLYCWNNPGARFEHVQVNRLPLEAYALYRDRFPTDDWNDWTVIDAPSATGTSAWATSDGTLRQTGDIHTPPIDRNTVSKLGTYVVAGDPAWTQIVLSVRLHSPTGEAIGLLFGYQGANDYYRFSMDRQQGYRRLVRCVGGVFETLWEDSVSYEPERTYELGIAVLADSLRGFLDGVPLFVVRPFVPPAGRIGLYTWHNTDARFSNVQVFPARVKYDNWLLDEPFGPTPAAKWAFVDEGNQDGPSNWVFQGGELSQLGSIHGNNDAGTYALAGSESWTDYRFATRLISDGSDTIGVVFRYRDKDNYYRFSMDRARSFRRLIRCAGGAVAVLWQDASAYDTGRAYVLTIDCIGELLRGYLDGVPLFAVSDGSHAAGRIGLYCWKNAKARFLEARAAEPIWVPYYIFRNEELMEAGSRVRVYAGNVVYQISGTAEKSGIERRFATALDERGRITLMPHHAELRSRTPVGTAGHTRAFISSAEYAPVPVKVLRKSDGTGIALFPVAGGPLAPGQYRLGLTYHPGAALGSVANPKEKVILDIPWLTQDQ